MVAMVAAFPNDIDSGNSPAVVPSVEGGVAYVAVLSLEAGWAQKTAVVTNSGLWIAARPCIRLADGVFDVSEDSKGLWIAVVFHGVYAVVSLFHWRQLPLITAPLCWGCREARGMSFNGDMLRTVSLWRGKACPVSPDLFQPWQWRGLWRG